MFSVNRSLLTNTKNILRPSLSKFTTSHFGSFCMHKAHPAQHKSKLPMCFFHSSAQADAPVEVPVKIGAQAYSSSIGIPIKIGASPSSKEEALNQFKLLLDKSTKLQTNDSFKELREFVLANKALLLLSEKYFQGDEFSKRLHQLTTQAHASNLVYILLKEFKSAKCF